MPDSTGTCPTIACATGKWWTIISFAYARYELVAASRRILPFGFAGRTKNGMWSSSSPACRRAA